MTPDGKTIAAATDDHRVTVWDATTGELKRIRRPRRLGPLGRSFARRHNARLGRRRSSLCVWDGHEHPVFQVPACKNSVSAVCIHPNSQQLAVVGFSNNLQIVNTSTGQHRKGWMPLRRHPHGRVFAERRPHGRGRSQWQDSHVERQRWSSQRDIETDGRRIRSLAFSPDGSRSPPPAVVRRFDVFDAATGEL